jgi:hypothetical protein
MTTKLFYHSCTRNFLDVPEAEEIDDTVESTDIGQDSDEEIIDEIEEIEEALQ